MKGFKRSAAHLLLFSSSSRTPDYSFLFLSHLLSLRPNYMEDGVIDKGESESPQQQVEDPLNSPQLTLLILTLAQ